MPPKHVNPSECDPTDVWTANPYKASNPKHREYETERKRAQRAALSRRFGGPTNLRVADYVKEEATSAVRDGGAAWEDRGNAERSPSPSTKATLNRPLAPPQPSVILAAESTVDATCLALLHGGATVWLGSKQGSVSVRSGGKVSENEGANEFQVLTADDLKEEASTVTVAVSVLAAVGNHVYAGLADGTVQRYDGYTAVRHYSVRPRKDSEGAIVEIVPHPNESVVLAVSEAGILHYFDGSDNQGESPCLRSALCPKGAIAAVFSGLGDAILLGTKEGELVKTDAEDLGIIRTANQGSPIRTIAATKDFIAIGIGSAVSLLSNTSLQTLCTVAHHETEVVALAVEVRAQRVVSVDAAGVLCQWAANCDSPTLRTRIQLPPSVSPKLLTRSVSDGSRIWSTAGSGVNLSWWMEHSPAKIEAIQALIDMKRIIEDDEAQVAAWEARLERARREKTMAECLANELMDAANGLGASMKKRDDMQKMAESNRAFAHYRW